MGGREGEIEVVELELRSARLAAPEIESETYLNSLESDSSVASCDSGYLRGSGERATEERVSMKEEVGGSEEGSKAQMPTYLPCEVRDLVDAPVGLGGQELVPKHVKSERHCLRVDGGLEEGSETKLITKVTRPPRLPRPTRDGVSSPSNGHHLLPQTCPNTKDPPTL